MSIDDLTQRITIDPNIAFGKPTIRGLRYSVERLLELLSSGMSPQEMLGDYEDLEAADIYAALGYAARLAQTKRMIAVGSAAAKPNWQQIKQPLILHRASLQCQTKKRLITNFSFLSHIAVLSLIT